MVTVPSRELPLLEDLASAPDYAHQRESSIATSSQQRHRRVEYISPEQIQGVTELDSRIDQYNFAVMTYELLTGKKPFERNNTWAIIHSHLEELPPDPRIHVYIPDAAAEVILRALSKKPEKRFSSVGEFVAALGKA